jgi:hypothetical protein
MGSDPSAGLVLHLSATTVKPGLVITRTVTGGGIGTSIAMHLQQCINGSWQTIYYTVSGSALGIAVTRQTLRRPHSGWCQPSARLLPCRSRMSEQAAPSDGPDGHYALLRSQ